MKEFRELATLVTKGRLYRHFDSRGGSMLLVGFSEPRAHESYLQKFGWSPSDPEYPRVLETILKEDYEGEVAVRILGDTSVFLSAVGHDVLAGYIGDAGYVGIKEQGEVWLAYTDRSPANGDHVAWFRDRFYVSKDAEELGEDAFGLIVEHA